MCQDICFEHEIPQEQTPAWQVAPQKAEKGNMCEPGDWKEIPYKAVCVFKREKKKKIVGVGGERRQDFPAGKNKRNLKVIATLSNL